MIRIGICDDNSDARLGLESALERALDRRRVQGQFFSFSERAFCAGWNITRANWI